MNQRSELIIIPNVISILDYTKTPGFRYGEDSGAEFRDKYIIPNIIEDEILHIDLNGVLGYPSSFLEEAFGGLVRKLGKQVIKQIRIIYGDELVIYDIYAYMNE